MLRQLVEESELQCGGEDRIVAKRKKSLPLWGVERDTWLVRRQPARLTEGGVTKFRPVPGRGTVADGGGGYPPRTPIERLRTKATPLHHAAHGPLPASGRQ